MYEGYSLLEVLKRTEIRHIKAALKQSHGVKALAAKKLGIKRTTLIEKLRRHGLVLFAEKVYANRPAVCKNGHSLDEAYQYKLASRGGRVRRICKACTKARYLKRREEVMVPALSVDEMPVPPKKAFCKKGHSLVAAYMYKGVVSGRVRYVCRLCAQDRYLAKKERQKLTATATAQV